MQGTPEGPGGPRISRRRLLAFTGAGASLLAVGPLLGGTASADHQPGHQSPNGGTRRWRPGDHHIHSEYSVTEDTSTNPPTIQIGGDAVYPIVTNAIMAKHFGLEWVQTTDHGGPTHSRVNLDLAYPDLLRSRQLVPDVLQFFGMEFDTPALDHHTLVIPHHDGEAQQLFQLESMFCKTDPFPEDPDPQH